MQTAETIFIFPRKTVFPLNRFIAGQHPLLRGNAFIAAFALQKCLILVIINKKSLFRQAETCKFHTIHFQPAGLKIESQKNKRGDRMSNLVITIARQFGSGGREIGKALADKLGIEFYDRELLRLAAKESGIDEELFENADEQPSNSFLYSAVMVNHVSLKSFLGYNDCITNDKLFIFTIETIRKLAQEKSCVIVGRCADYILKDHENCVNVFIHANYEDRLKTVMETKELTKEQAKSLIKKTDKRRSAYYSYYSDKTWGDVNEYDLCVNSSNLTVEKAADVIDFYIKNRK